MTPPITRQEVGRAIARLMPNIIRGVQLDFFAQRQVTQTQLLVLVALHALGRCTMGSLARSFHISLPTATGLVDRLAKPGYVRRFPNPEDRRQVMVALTDKGRAFIHEFQGVMRRRWEEVLRVLSSDELASYHRIIIKLTEALERRP